MRTLVLVSLFALVACSSPAGSSPSAPAEAAEPGGARQEAPRVLIEAGGGEHVFRVEIADTDQTRARGLMFRDQLDENAGMLFLFDRMARQSFWMKNTRIPLDMLFIDEHGEIVGIVENAEPFTLSSRGVSRSSRYVLELNGGTCRRLGIRAGMTSRFVGVPGHPARAPGPTR